MNKYQCVLSILCLLTLTLSTAGAQAADSLQFRTSDQAVLNVYWTDTAPVMDGQMDDACWQEAEVAADFFLFKHAGVPLNQTEVRLAYDAEHLYVFWTLYEKDMLQLAMGRPDDTRDHIRWDDCAELFLDPGRTEESYYQFAANPSAGIYDAVYSPTFSSVNEFSPDWEVAVGRCEGGWTLEERIPFGELALPGSLLATPQVGDHWGLTFARNQGALHEWSQWVPTDRSFHETQHNGHLHFRGRKDGKALPAVSEAKPGSLFFGPSALDFTVQNAPDLKVTATIQRGDQTPSALAPTIKDGAVTVPYQLLEGGVSRLRFSLSIAGRVFYTGTAVADQPLIRAPLEAWAAQGKADQDVLAKMGTPHPRFATIRARLADFLGRTKAAHAQVMKGNSLNASEWQALIQETGELEEDWQGLRFDIALAKAYPGKQGEPLVAFAIGSGTESDKFYPDLPFEGPTTGPIRLALAGNEYGSYQLVILPFWRNLREVQVTCSALRGPGGIISAEASRWFRVSYVKLENWSARTSPGCEYEPDPLIPAAPFTVRGGTLAAVWVDVLLPPGTPAGVYQGMVTISAGGQEVSRIVEVRARGFDLPRFTSFESELWYNVYNWDHFYGKVDYTPEMHARHAEVLGRYRVGSIPVDMVKMCPKLTIYHEPDGHFSFDFSEIDKFIKQGLEHGSRSFWSCFACCAGWTWWLNDPSRPVIERADGKTRRIGDYVRLDIWNGVYDPATYKHNPLYREFLVAYVEHLKQLGINDFSYWELFDEPNDNSRWLAMLEHHKWLREVVPDLKLLNFGVDPTVTRMGKNAWGLIDAWAPHLPDITPEEDAVIKERRAKYGEKYWGYTCGERNDGQGNYSPYIRYDRPYISARMHYWATWRHQMDGFLVFASSGVPEGNRQKGPEERWPNSDWVDGGSRGCGTLVYPGADFELIPGMRLANLREGLEDQEYFILLRKLAKALDPVRDAALLARVNQGLEIEPEIMADAYHWTKDPVRLEAKREQLSRLILELQAIAR